MCRQDTTDTFVCVYDRYVCVGVKVRTVGIYTCVGVLFDVYVCRILPTHVYTPTVYTYYVHLLYVRTVQ